MDVGSLRRGQHRTAPQQLADRKSGEFARLQIRINNVLIDRRQRAAGNQAHARSDRRFEIRFQAS
jgi:hypothetical protein